MNRDLFWRLSKLYVCLISCVESIRSLAQRESKANGLSGYDLWGTRSGTSDNNGWQCRRSFANRIEHARGDNDNGN